MHPILKLAKQRCVIFDGAMGTEIEARGAIADDFGTLPQINEVLCLTKPDLISDIHRAYIGAGADVIETNTFSSNRIALQEYGLQDRVRELNLAAVRLAVEAAKHGPDNKRIFVSGSTGPGTKLPSLGQISFDKLFDAYLEQAMALIEGGVDVIQVETTQDPLQTKAACMACVEARRRTGADVLIIGQGTFDSNGRMLLGTTPEAFVTTISAIDGVDVLGLNCSTGPAQMYPVLNAITKRSPLPVIVLPNAGFPKSKGKKSYYDLTPAKYTEHMTAFVRDFGVELIGGCCGTGPAHISALHEALKTVKRGQRRPVKPSSASSLYIDMPFYQEPRPLIVGERTNASGSKAFRNALLTQDMETMGEIAGNQAAEGAHLLDVNVAWAGRKEGADMTNTMGILRQTIRQPIMIDSTDPETIEIALKNYPGKAVINSVNLDEPEKLHRIANLARRYGAAIVVLAIDEHGMAKTAHEKAEILQKIVKILHEEHKIDPANCFLDTLTFTVASGENSLRRAAIETLNAIKELKRVLPGSPTILGVSNISYGLKAGARKVLNSVFLHHALDAGLDAAILNAGKIIHPDAIPVQAGKLAENLLFDRNEDALTDYIEYFRDKKAGTEEVIPKDPKDQLFRMVVRGKVKGLEGIMEETLKDLQPQDVVNRVLLKAMARVGEMFASGELQLPFVLRSAQVTKGAMAVLEPLLRKKKVKPKGTVVLATVKGDVHDIGKNLVGIILSNSGWKIIDLGTMQPLPAILKAAKEHNAVAIGLSGLLLKSAMIMKEDLQEMRRMGLQTPVLVGGAALSRRFVQEDLVPQYDGPVFYCRDAFDAIRALDSVIKGDPGTIAERHREARKKQSPKVTFKPETVPSRHPPFLGNMTFDRIELSEVLKCLDHEALFLRRWKFREKDDWDKLKADKLEPLLTDLLEKYGMLLKPAGIVGFYPACAEGERIKVMDADHKHSFTVNTPDGKPGLSGFLPACEKEPDFLGLAVATVGETIAMKEKELYASDEFESYFYLHGLAVEVAEATMSFLHAWIAEKWGIGVRNCKPTQGGRFSIGYPACPDLEDQAGLLNMLGAKNISVRLTQNFQMYPEASVTALIFHHPQAGGRHQ